ncbi:MAG: PIN domain [Phormidesmis priestleyi Ana]|uniref:PIN domain n=1 Tax=Phormidesmis priestleyi Ana TaxID=1666911 RepID=A0A0P7YMM2_9CYAN|nr:MAG: PIN domain [Phormidesmis priestleyi Ana]
MTIIRTFLDAGVLISAARGMGKESDAALQIIRDPNREFASSQFLKLEVLPKAIFNKKTLEAEFYETYFEAVAYWATDIEKLCQAGYREAANFGLGAMDALHVAAAVETHSDEFITSEKLSKSIHRTRSILIVSISS